MSDLIRYIHGSEDSIDLDVYYVFDEMPEFSECKRFCSADKSENRNIICIKDGVVTDCFIGIPDEVNNSLFYTYKLHLQEYPLLIKGPVKRDIYRKDIRAVRGILSTLSRTQYRPEIKRALDGSWDDRLACLKTIDFSTIDFNNLDKNHNGKDALKVIVFQLGQSIGLHEGVELYTKSAIADIYEGLEPFLYRKDADPGILNDFVDKFLEILYSVKAVSNDRQVTFPDGRTFDLIHENEVKNNVYNYDER